MNKISAPSSNFKGIDSSFGSIFKDTTLLIEQINNYFNECEGKIVNFRSQDGTRIKQKM